MGRNRARERRCTNGKSDETPQVARRALGSWQVLGDMYNMRRPSSTVPNGGREGRKGKLTTVWVVRVIIGDIDGASVELAFGWYIRNATGNL